MKLNEALHALDPANDDHWTSDGLPRIDAVTAFTRKPVTRAELTEKAPGFTREALAIAMAENVPGELEAQDEATEDPPSTHEPQAKVPDPDLDEEDPRDFAHVEPADDVVSMDPRQVFSDLELTDRGLAEFSRQNMILVRRKNEIEKKINDIGRRTAIIERERSRLAKAVGEDKGAAGIKAYQAAQARARQEKAARARKFIEAGTTVEDVRKQLGGKSDIDAALNNRGRGKGRPSHPAMNTLGG